MGESEKRIPFSLFNSKALFNPYQYLPLEKIMKWEDGKYGLNGKNLLITDEVGVGKTFETGIILQELLNIYPDITVLILCPVKLCANWVSELWDNFYIGAENYRENKVFDQITVIPYSAFSNNNANNMQEELRYENELILEENNSKNCKFLENFRTVLGQYDVLIMDEAHYVRNGGKLWHDVKELVDKYESKCGLRVFMTGTPIFNRNEDYENIKSLLTLGTHEFETTNTLQGEANCYDYMLDIKLGPDGRLIHWSDDEAAIYDEISRKVIVTKSELTPDGNEINTEREVSKYGRRAGIMKQYSSSSFHSLIEWIRHPNTDESEFINIKYEPEDMDDLSITSDDIRQILEIPEVKGYSAESDSKLKSLKELLRNLKNEEKASNEPYKVIIFSRFRLTCEYIEEQLKEYYVVRMITGTTSVKDVERIKLEFKNTKDPFILICSDAAKEGHNFQFCHYLIHYDLPFTPATIGQRNGRIYRKGQKENPKCFYMLMGTGDGKQQKYQFDGYDDRLFKEIITEKCHIVERSAKEYAVSRMNVLPKDAIGIINDYLDDYFVISEKQGNESEKATIQIKKAKQLLLKRYSDYFPMSHKTGCNSGELEAKTIKWYKDEARNLYVSLDIASNDTDSISKLLESVKKLWIDEYNANKDGLMDLYIDRYAKTLQNFIDAHFIRENEVGNNENLNKAELQKQRFVDACREYLHRYNAEGSIYCHDVIEAELKEEPFDIDEYKDQFVPLVEKLRSRRKDINQV